MPRLAPGQAYLVATATTLAALAARVALDPIFNPYPGIVVFLLPIFLSAYLGGLRGGLAATFLSWTASQALVLLPLQPMLSGAPFHWLQLFLVLAGIVTSGLGESLHRARERASESACKRDAAEASLRRDAALLGNAQRLAGLGIWEQDIASGVRRWSDETCRIFGVATGTFTQSHEAFYAFIHPGDVERIRRLSREDPAGRIVEYRIVRPDGEVRVVSQRGEIIRDPEGRPLQRIGVIMDITDRTAAEERYRSLFENSAEGIFQNTPEGRMLAVNPAFARMLGYDSPGELVRARVDIARQGYAEPAQRVAFQRRLESEGAIEGFEYEVLRKDGTRIWISENVRVVRGADGKALRYEGSAQDITVRRHAEQALRQQTAELRVLFDLVPAMIWFKDTENRILRVNQRVADAAGRAIAEIEGRPSGEIYPRDAAVYYAADREVTDSGKPLLGLVERLLDAGGNEIWIETDKVPFFGEDGAVAGIVVIAHDITDRKRAESELRKTHDQLVRASRLSGMAEVAVEVLHNVGNILNSVNVSASLVVENVRNSRASRMADVVALLREHREDLASYITADPAGRHIPEMLEDLSREWAAQQQLLVTELEALHRNVDLIKQVIAEQRIRAVAGEVVEEVPVEELVEDAVRVQQGVLSKHQVVLVRKFCSMPPVSVAKHKAVQILVSLLRNGRQACRHLDPGNRCITLRTTRLDSRAAISVTDNGQGIEADNLVRIFAPGYTTRPEASGFGLHTAALAATELGGTLEVQSDGPGRGATFTLQLPFAAAA